MIVSYNKQCLGLTLDFLDLLSLVPLNSLDCLAR